MMNSMSSDANGTAMFCTQFSILKQKDTISYTDG